MPLGLLVTIVVLGIAAIAVLSHVWGFSRPFAIDSDERARAEWLRHWPDDEVARVIRATDGHAALVETAQGAGLLWSFGADTVARRIRGARLSPCDKGLRLALHDFTAPAVTIALRPDERAEWQAAIERMIR